MKPFDASDWYWQLVGTTTQVYSSRVGDLIPVTDATYQAWLAGGNQPRQIASGAELGEVLVPYEDVIARPVQPQVLDGFKNKKADIATEIFKLLLGPTNLNMENRLRAVERATGISTAPDLTAAQLKQLLKSLA